MKKHWVVILWIIIWLIPVFSILNNLEISFDNADGIMHYLIARYAHLHPELFLDQWGKPFYTIMAWPFAQFGLKGVMLMNIFLSVGSMILAYSICKSLEIKFPWISVIILSVSTSYFTLMYSGLTEHAFSFILVLSVFLLLKNKWLVGSLVLSTLPFFRQEGYFMIAALLPFYFYHRKIKYIPLLSIAFIIIATIGAIVYKNVLWIAGANPYGFSKIYGSGTWWTFFNHLYYNFGLINLIFFVLGLIVLFFFMFKKRISNHTHLFLLVFLPFFVFFSSHVIFWYFGIFQSLGLSRVLNCVAPLFAIIAALGFSKPIERIPPVINKIMILCLTLIVITYPLNPPNPSSITKQFQRKYSELELQIRDLAPYLKSRYPHAFIYYEHPMVAYYWEIDPFDHDQCDHLQAINQVDLKPGALVIWEKGITAVHTGITRESLDSRTDLEKLIDDWPLYGHGKMNINSVNDHALIIYRVKKKVE